MTSGHVFKSTTLAWLIGLGSLAFVLVMVISVFFSGAKYMGSAGADSFSPSAIGHKALFEGMEQAGFVVQRSQNNTAEKLSVTNVLFLIEPALDDKKKDELQQMLSFHNVLLVLPKRTGFPGFNNRRWIGIKSRVTDKAFSNIFDLIEEYDPDTNGAYEIIQAKTTRRWTLDGFANAPTINDPQLLKWDQIDPLISTAEGTLLGILRRPNANFLILSDPDILQNHGISLGDNAALVFEVLNRLVPPGDVVVVDETAHGHLISPSVVKSAFEPPFLFPTILFLMALFALVLATAKRFSTPRPEKEAFTRSKMPLIGNISNLLGFAGHYGTISERYFDGILREAAERLNAPPGLHGPELVKWLDKVSVRRNTFNKFETLLARQRASQTTDAKNPARQLKLARDVYQWKKEILDGSEKNKDTE